MVVMPIIEVGWLDVSRCRVVAAVAGVDCATVGTVAVDCGAIGQACCVGVVSYGVTGVVVTYVRGVMGAAAAGGGLRQCCWRCMDANGFIVIRGVTGVGWAVMVPVGPVLVLVVMMVVMVGLVVFALIIAPVFGV
jgi:hypothetical protein